MVMTLRQCKGGLEDVPDEIMFTPDKRASHASSATLSNVGPQHTGRIDDEEMDLVEGTTSGMGSQRRGLRGKPARGSREDPRI